jgi:hypothetical protein
MPNGVAFSVDFSVEEKGRKSPEYTLDTDLNGEVSLLDFLNFTKSALIITADTVLREEQARGFDKNPVVAVDGKVGVPVFNVSPLGQLEFTSKANMSEILLETYKGILKRSPVLTGRYKSSHFVFLNGAQVATDLESLRAWLKSNPIFNDKDLIRFVNIQPYARKLERLGVTGRRQQSRTVKSRDKRKSSQGHRILAPNGAYFLTTRSIRSKYKRNSVIRFNFISGDRLGISGSFLGRRGKPGRPYLYPTITISAAEGGTV